MSHQPTDELLSIRAAEVVRLFVDGAWHQRGDGQLRVRRRSRSRIEVAAGKRMWKVALEVRQSAVAWNAWLLCPERGTRHRALYIQGERLASRAALGVPYPSQSLDHAGRLSRRRDHLREQLQGGPNRGPARGDRRSRLLKALSTILEQLQVTGVNDRELRSLLQAEADRDHQRGRRRRRASAQAPPLSMTAALAAGRSKARRKSSWKLRWLLRAPLAESPRPATILGSAPASTCPEIDLRLLKPRRGRASAHQLIWPLSGGQDEVVAITLLSVAAAVAELRIRWRCGVASGEQIVQLVSGARPGDMFAVCPVTGARCVKLYWREGRFASRQAQQLTYQRPS